jgi:TP901 family phage tail tape measure protein
VAERSIIVRFRAEVAQFKANTQAASNTLSEFSKRSNDTARKHRTEWDQVGRQTAIAGLAIGAALGIGIKRFADFDQAMSGAAAGTRATVNELGALREAAIKAGADTQFSATEAAQAITEMGKAGVGVKDILGGGLNGALNLAAAGQLEVGRAAEIAATALNQFGLKGVNVAHVSDLYAAAAGKAQGSVEDVAQAMKFAGVTANSLNVSIEETTGTIGLFASKGIIGEQAGTTFRSMLLSLTSPSKIAKQAMDDLGISMYDASGKFVGIQGAAEELHKRLGPLDEATRNQALGQIFGNESMNGAITLYEGGAAAVQDWTKRVNDAGYAQEQAAKLTDNWKGDLERLGGSLDSVLVKNGSTVNGALRGITQGLEDMVDGFGALPGPVQGTVVALTAATSAAAILGGGMLYLVPKVAAAKAAVVELGIVSEATAGRMTALGATAGKVAAGAAAIAAVAASANELAKYAPGVDSASVSISKLADDLERMTRGSTDTTALQELFSSSGLRGKDINDTATALDHFAGSAEHAFGKNLDTQINRFTEFGQGSERFEGQVAQLDKALAGLADAGRTNEAYNAYTKLITQLENANDAGANIDISKVKSLFVEYTPSVEAAAAATKVMAKELDTAKGALVGAEGSAGATGSAMLLLGANAGTAKDEVADLAKVIQSDMDAASKAFLASTDVLGKYDPAAAAEKAKTASEKVAAAEQAAQDTRERVAAKKKRTVSDTQALDRSAAAVDKARAEEKVANAALGEAGLTAMYRNTIAEARKFTADIDEASRRGLDPNTIAKLLQEGAEKAAPALEALVGSNSAELIKLSNSAEAEIRKINSRVVEQSRLTSLALNATTDQMGQDLDVAMAIAAEKAAQGGRASGESIARELGLKLPEVRRIAGEFGIVLASIPPPPAIPVTVNTAQGRANLKDLQQQLANLDGATVHTALEIRIADQRDARQDRANSPVLSRPGEKKIQRAYGGPIPGYAPNPRADNVELRATPGEHMWAVDEVKGAGGHAVVSQLRALARSGQLGGVRAGGFSGGPVPSSHTETNTRTVNHYGDIVAPSTQSYEEELARRNLVEI